MTRIRNEHDIEVRTKKKNMTKIKHKKRILQNDQHLT